MTVNFNSVADAIDAGYELSGRAGRVLARSDTHDLVVTDTSGGRWFGYSFGIKAIPNEEAIREGHTSGEVLVQTVMIGTKDLNRLGRPGSFRPMFRPGTVEQAIRSFGRRI